mmetsp:Transcript_3387/g.6341  ORF Transcript_3387/g.6341 Transcript_3387/m.6341 type:complete len:116 (+) Transcript_3387:47-394(+)
MQFSIKITAAVFVTVLAAIVEDLGYQIAFLGLAVLCTLGALPILIFSCCPSSTAKQSSDSSDHLAIEMRPANAKAQRQLETTSTSKLEKQPTGPEGLRQQKSFATPMTQQRMEHV